MPQTKYDLGMKILSIVYIITKLIINTLISTGVMSHTALLDSILLSVDSLTFLLMDRTHVRHGDKDKVNINVNTANMSDTLQHNNHMSESTLVPPNTPNEPIELETV